MRLRQVCRSNKPCASASSWPNACAICEFIILVRRCCAISASAWAYARALPAPPTVPLSFCKERSSSCSWRRNLDEIRPRRRSDFDRVALVRAGEKSRGTKTAVPRLFSPCLTRARADQYHFAGATRVLSALELPTIAHDVARLMVVAPFETHPPAPCD